MWAENDDVGRIWIQEWKAESVFRLLDGLFSLINSLVSDDVPSTIVLDNRKPKITMHVKPCNAI